jgi:hypothetical protein
VANEMEHAASRESAFEGPAGCRRASADVRNETCVRRRKRG